MKIRDYLLYAIVLLLCGLGMFFLTKVAKANIIYNDSGTNLLIEYQTKTKPSAGPKSSYQKYAAVYFIFGNKNLTSEANNDDLSGIPIKNADCPSGYVWHQGLCEVKCNTSLYPYDTAPEAKKGTVVSVKCVLNSSLVTRYMYTKCNSGWDLSNNKCEVHQCSTSDYPYTSNPGGTAGVVKAACKTGTEYQYGYSSCYEGWDKNGSMCTIHTCDRTIYPISGTADSAKGTYSICKSGTSSYSGYTSCKEGWTLSGARCLENECSGYGSGTATIAHCNNSESCQKGSTKVYKCTSCQSGYGVNGSGLCEIITCPTGQINIYTYWCSDDWRCLMPGG